jgi:hypothetical protein
VNESGLEAGQLGDEQLGQAAEEDADPSQTACEAEAGRRDLGLGGGFEHHPTDQTHHDQMDDQLLLEGRRSPAVPVGDPQRGLEIPIEGLSGKGLARCLVSRPVSSPSPSELLVRFSLKQLTR